MDQQEKERKKAEIEQRISVIQQELDEKMTTLESSSDATAQREYEKAKTLSDSLSQLSTLGLDILDDVPPAEDKAWYEKAWDWTKEAG